MRYPSPLRSGTTITYADATTWPLTMALMMCCPKDRLDGMVTVVVKAPFWSVTKVPIVWGWDVDGARADCDWLWLLASTSIRPGLFDEPLVPDRVSDWPGSTVKTSPWANVPEGPSQSGA